MKEPRYSDGRYPNGYATAAQSEEANYLRDKFKAIRERIEREKQQEPPSRAINIKRRAA